MTSSLFLLNQAIGTYMCFYMFCVKNIETCKKICVEVWKDIPKIANSDHLQVVELGMIFFGIIIYLLLF